MNLRICEIVLYQEHFPEIDDITQICDGHRTIKEYACILHDKDTDTSGNLKKPHYHLVINFGRGVETKNCEKWFGCAPNAISKIKGRWKDALLYLTHRNSPEKYQYSDLEVSANFDYPEEVERLIKDEKNRLSATKQTELCNAVMLGNISLSQGLAELQKYNYKSSAQKQLDDAYKLRCRNLSADRSVDVILIFGESETGKTTLAKMLCVADGADYYISSSDNDTLQDYAGERVLIIDDAREETFSLVDWLKLLDNNTQTSIKSRFYNKAFVGDTIIITTSVNPVYWFRGTYEQRWQFYRRISQFWVVTKDAIYQYDGFEITGNNLVKPVATGIAYGNPVSRLYATKKQSGAANRVASLLGKLIVQTNEELEKNMEEVSESVARFEN